jgi:ABC-type sugar transport system ATPase subunit
MMDATNIIEFKNITKSFPGIVAVDDVSFSIKKGEVHAIVGENGAGKSTLIKILSGIQKADDGKILIGGKETVIDTPNDAFDHGITSIYQELPLAPSLTVADNVFLGQERMKFGFLNKKDQNREVENYFKEFDIAINPKSPVEKLSVSMQQITAIIKSMLKEARVFIMDEPTAALGEHEVEKLFDFIRKLKKRDISVIYISHRMDEIFGIADRVTVLKDGKYMGTKTVSAINRSELINLMSGKKVEELSQLHKDKSSLEGDTVLEVLELSYKNILHDISFTVKRGEIFGITGLVGAGKTELLKCIYGLFDYDRGEVNILDTKDSSTNTRTKRNSKSRRKFLSQKHFQFGFVPEDRKKEGLFLDLDILRNISISSLQFLSRLSYVLRKKESEIAKQSMESLDIKARGISQRVKFLSGGNQQKVILSRWLISRKKILLLDEPTRGVDVLAKTEIYKLIKRMSREGITVIFCSSDVGEILTVSDRVAAMRNGRIIEIVERKDFDNEKLLHDIMFD